MAPHGVRCWHGAHGTCLLQGETYEEMGRGGAPDANAICWLWMQHGHNCDTVWSSVCPNMLNPQGEDKNEDQLSQTGCSQCGGDGTLIQPEGCFPALQKECAPAAVCFTGACAGNIEGACAQCAAAAGCAPCFQS